MPEFKPYTKPHGIDGLQFFYGNQEAADWYDPIKPYVRLEYEWVLANVNIKGAQVLDGGAHHGHYSILFKEAATIVCVEPVPENCALLALNLQQNGVQHARIVPGALHPARATLIYNGAMVECYPPAEVLPEATIVKLDIEGAEYSVFPLALATMPAVRTWLVECHPTHGDPDAIARLMWQHGMKVWKVDRARMQVIDYLAGTAWQTHDTLIGKKKE